MFYFSVSPFSSFITVNLQRGSVVSVLQIRGGGEEKDLLMARYIIFLTHLAP